MTYAPDLTQKTTPLEALSKYGLDWTVDTAPLLWSPQTWYKPGADAVPVPSGHRAVYRVVDGEFLAPVSAKYRPIQNREIAAAIESALPGEPTIVAGGEYRGGKRVWLQADLGEMQIGGLDPVRRFALFYSDHDGGGALTVAPATFRIWCLNQLNAATDQHERVKIVHRGNLDTSKVADTIRAALTGTARWLEEFEQAATALAEDKAIDGTWLGKFFQRAYLAACTPATRDLICAPPSHDESVRARQIKAAGKAAKRVAAMAERYESCDDGELPSALQHSRWHAFNAATEVIDHGSRFNAESVQLGRASKAKSDIFALAGSLEM